jgi:hypothetical protein
MSNELESALKRIAELEQEIENLELQLSSALDTVSYRQRQTTELEAWKIGALSGFETIARKANAIKNETTDQIVHALALGVYTIAKKDESGGE